MKYKVILASDEEHLETFVESRLKSGWSLQGGISVVHNTRLGYRYAQAMVKYD